MIAIYNTHTQLLEICKSIDNPEPLWTGKYIPGEIITGFECIPRNKAVGVIDEEAFQKWLN